MQVEPLLTYRKPKYPRLAEGVPPHFLLPRNRSKALIAAMLVISSTLAGCGTNDPGRPGGGGVFLGGVPPREPRLLSEAEIIQILQNEAEARGIAFERWLDIPVKYSDLDIILDLYNEEKRVGVAVIDRGQANELRGTDAWENIRGSGMAAQGSLEDEQTVDFFLTSEYIREYYDEENLRQAFREFIEWLQAEGII
ncbi:MAG: hypothetical protein FWD39_01925 [Clostridiales bacterium]|nr:hypothetical protein [Clostridiales bacterium]